MTAEAGVEIPLVQLDVADDASVTRGFAEILERAGRVDVLVNNAGIGGQAAVEDTSPQLILDTVNVNVCGAVRCLQAVLPGMRERKSGAIVNITSVVGRFGAIAQAPYVASKWAFEGISEELAYELAPFNIRVAVVEPGVTKSAIFAKNLDVENANPAYEMHYRRLFNFYGAGIPQATDPFEVAAVVRHAIETDEPRLRYSCAWGGTEIIEGRQRLSDADWVALGAIADDDAYHAAFTAAFGLDITPPGS